jgi:hypothetical protein
MPDLETLFSELDELRPSDELDRRIAGLAAATRAHSSLRRRSRRASLVFGAAGAIAVILIGLAVAAHSRSSNGPAQPSVPRRQPLTPANLLGAIQAHGFNEISVLPNGRAICQFVPGNSVQYGYESTLKVNPSGFPKAQVRAGALFQVMPSAAIARACAREIIDRTLYKLGPPHTNRRSPWKRLSTSIFEDPFCGLSCGELPILTHGDVRRDGSYSIIAARGRILLLGIASDRPDAFAVDRAMKNVAAVFTG